MFEVKHALLNCHSRFSPARAERLRVLTLLLVVALMTTVCDGAAQAQTIDLPMDWTKSLKLSGNLPAGTVNEAYNAVLSVDGGRSPYFFLVYEGALPPGISLNPGTGTLSGKALAAGTFRFEVVVMEPFLH